MPVTVRSILPSPATQLPAGSCPKITSPPLSAPQRCRFALYHTQRAAAPPHPLSALKAEARPTTQTTRDEWLNCAGVWGKPRKPAQEKQGHWIERKKE
ncbi:hypothetical protein RRG08_011257 [Elysia crispata]|uniref:Uncharacterized protein n=1 Tax=Elysia crispata TaxID=231223 RepID=A0AAE1D2M5_9GAST|nr:hypothetical protein RRG08_011257 [Elysia crispata]